MEDILTAQLLGGFRLVDGSTPVTGLQPARLQGLFAYLVLHRGRPQSRAHLAALFWPESTDGQARTNLRRLVLDLRRAVPRPERHVHIDHHVLQWLESSPLRLDVEEFQRGVRADASLGDLEQAVVLYRGDLLPECYDDWVIPERERLRQVYFQAVERIVVGLEAQRDYRGAIRYARLLLQHEPMEEATYRHLMRLHALNGDRTGAVRIYHACVTALQRDLGVAPSPATQKAYERILAVDTLAAHAPTMATPQALPPLVGRADEWARLQQAWHARQSRVVLLRGEAGVGKSRLAEELLTWAGRQGIATVRVGCYAAEAELAYAPVASLLRARPLPQVGPEWRRELARLLSEVSMGNPTGDLPDPITEGWQRQRFFEGTARALLVDQPLLVVIDDLQWCDKESLEWFHFLTRVDPAAPMLLLGTVRTEETDASHPLHRVVASWRHTGMIMEINVPPLDQL
ncbi:MAG: AAA family ATPase [Armatimonadota bacterium]